MKIEILGTGCPKCKATIENVNKALAELGKTAEVVKVTDINAIIGRGVMHTPAVVVDGKVVVQGRLPKPDEIKNWIQ